MSFPTIYLASASPRRHEILLQMGVEHEVLNVPAPPGEDEPRLPGEEAARYVRRTAREKAVRAQAWLIESLKDGAISGLADRPILSADTTVILDGDVLGKPHDAEHAAQLLSRLSGATHCVHTAVVLAAGGQLFEDVSITDVRFKTLTLAEIEEYCSTGEPMGKAGAYGIQGKAGMLIERISGSFTGVMGLPMFETARLLRTLL
jgi:septum formation protein